MARFINNPEMSEMSKRKRKAVGYRCFIISPFVRKTFMNNAPVEKFFADRAERDPYN